MARDSGTKQNDITEESQGRRQLLKLATYVPPAMLGVMVSANKMAQAAVVGQTINCGGAGTIVVSAGGMACCPCVPTSNRYNLNTCNMNRCQLGNCTACTQVAFTSVRQCNRKVAQSGCTCVCTPIGGGGGWRRRRRGPATCV